MNDACGGGGRDSQPKDASEHGGQGDCPRVSACAAEAQTPFAWFDRMISNCLEYATAAKKARAADRGDPL